MTIEQEASPRVGYARDGFYIHAASKSGGWVARFLHRPDVCLVICAGKLPESRGPDSGAASFAVGPAARQCQFLSG